MSDIDSLISIDLVEFTKDINPVFVGKAGSRLKAL